MAASLLCAPVVYPWYLLWMLPFLRSASTLPIIIWTVSIIPTYFVWHLRALGRPWIVPGWIMLLEYGSVAAAGLIILLRRVGRRFSAAFGIVPVKRVRWSFCESIAPILRSGLNAGLKGPHHQDQRSLTYVSVS